MIYRPRIVEDELERKLGSISTILIEGPKAVGKTATARRYSASEVLLDVDEAARAAARLDPALVLEGPRPRLVDEWQMVPAIWNHVRRASDTAATPGQFILTGSTLPGEEAARHTGAGRISRVRMRPMTLTEAGCSTASISVAGLLAGDSVRASDSGLRLEDVVDYICRGGWPSTVDSDIGRAQEFVRDYIGEARHLDISGAGRSRRDPNRVLRMLRSLARNVATGASLATIATDTGGSDGPLDVQTVRAYHDGLERLFVVEDQPAWSPRIRSRSRLRTSPRRHFVDPSIAVGVLRLGPDYLIRDLNFLGLLFESLVIRDLRVYAQAVDGEVYHYRDDTGLEVDAIVETVAGQWIAVEVKLGGQDSIDHGAKSLVRFRDRIDIDRMGPPSKLVVVTATGFAYDRDDGVAVVPIGLLGP